LKTYPRVQPKLPEGLGAVTLNLQYGGLESPMKFYMIDAEPSYRALLGWLWLHNNQFFLSKESKEKDKFSESVKTSRNVMQTKNQNMMSFQRKKKKSSFTSNLIPYFKPKDQAMDQMKRAAFQVETSSNEESEESEDSGHTMSRNIPVYGRVRE
jgi:hypothetical protein